MLIEKYKVDESNANWDREHKRQLAFVTEGIAHADRVIDKLEAFQVAIPSWALGAGGTRFGRFSIGADPEMKNHQQAIR